MQFLALHPRLPACQKGRAATFGEHGTGRLSTLVRAQAPSSDVRSTPTVFRRVEELVVTNLSRDIPGGRLDWSQVGDCWVIRPPAAVGSAEAVVLFVGGAFVGAVPELAYKLFLEALAHRRILVVAVPYATQFDLDRTADDIQDAFLHTMQLLTAEVRGLPVYGVGHSSGALLTLLTNSRYSVRCDGNILMSYRNPSAENVIPFLNPILADGTRALGPMLSQAASNPISVAARSIFDSAKMMSPSFIKMALPIVEQLPPVFMDVAHNRKEFTPAPDETAEMIQQYYSAPRTMLMRFVDDEADETIKLSAILQNSNCRDVTIKTVPGNEARPMVQNFIDVPEGIARVASTTVKTSGTVLGSLSAVARDVGMYEMESPLKRFGRQVEEAATGFGGESGEGGPITSSVTTLANEIAAWMGVGNVVSRGKRSMALPEKSTIVER